MIEKLTLEDTRSPVWRKVTAYAEEELRILRKNLESDVTHERTIKLRGEIRRLVLLLALGYPPAPAFEEEEDPD